MDKHPKQSKKVAFLFTPVTRVLDKALLDQAIQELLENWRSGDRGNYATKDGTLYFRLVDPLTYQIVSVAEMKRGRTHPT